MVKKNRKVLPLSMALRAAVYSETDHSLMAHIAEKNCWNSDRAIPGGLTDTVANKLAASNDGKLL